MSELNELKRIGAAPQKNSGRGKHRKGDGVINGEFLVDVKEYAKGFRIDRNNWGKVCTDAASEGMEPALFLVLGEENAPRTRLWVFTEEMGNEYFELKRRQNEIQN